MEADPEQIAEAAFNLLAAVGAYKDDPTSLADEMVPELAAEALWIGAVTAMAAMVTYAEIDAEDLILIGAGFAVADDEDIHPEDAEYGEMMDELAAVATANVDARGLPCGCMPDEVAVFGHKCGSDAA